MTIKGKSVRSAEKLIAQARGANEVRFALNLKRASPEMLSAIGLPDNPAIGDKFLPGAIGKATTFNAQGSEVVRRDLPLEDVPVSSYRSWEDWHGQSHSGIQYRTVKKYPRDLILPPGEELQVLEIDEEVYLATRWFSLRDESEAALVHLANVMLECFGEFDVVDAKVGKVIQRQIRNLSWEILPPGEYPWARAAPILRDLTRSLSDATRPVCEERLQTISAYNPGFLARGRGGFDGYVVLGFPQKGMYVLESVRFGNATYVFSDDWEFLSQLTKAQIIKGDLARYRIIHDRQWRGRIRALLAAK